MKVEIVTPDRALLEKFKSIRLMKTIRAVAAVRGEEVLGVAGLYCDGTWTQMFSALTDELRRDRRGLVKISRAVMDLARPRAPVYAEADPEIEGSRKLLEHLGFKPVRGNLYVWETC